MVDVEDVRCGVVHCELGGAAASLMDVVVVSSCWGVWCSSGWCAHIGADLGGWFGAHGVRMVGARWGVEAWREVLAVEVLLLLGGVLVVVVVGVVVVIMG